MLLPVNASDLSIEVLGRALQNGALAFSQYDQTALDEFVNRYQVVFAVWIKGGRIECTPIKGRDIFSSGDSYSFNSVPVASREFVIALLERYGDPIWIDDAPALPPKRKLRLVFNADS